MRRKKYALMYAKDLAIPPGGATGNTELVEFRSLWAAAKYIIATKPARRSIIAGRFFWMQVGARTP